MNKVILMGRLTRDAQTRYTEGAEPMAISRFTLAVDRRVQRDQEGQSADFISCVAFGKTGQFMEKYGQQGTKFDPEWTKEEMIKAVSEYSGFPEEEIEVLLESTAKWAQETGRQNGQDCSCEKNCSAITDAK